MNLKHLIFGFAALTTLGLASCSNDMQEGPETVGSKQIRYIQVQISGADGMDSRAANDDPSFADATDAENTVKDILFLFYGVDGSRTGSPVLLSNPQFVDATTSEYPNVGKVLSSVVGVEMDADDAVPAYVMAFLNPARNSAGVTTYQDMSLTELYKAFTTNVINEQGCFLMSNSTFYKADGNLQIATPIAEGQLFKTIEAAQAATGGAITNIYVERYAAKVALTLAAANVQNATVVDADGNNITLSFTPAQWFINNSDFYVFRTKTYGKENTSVVPSYESFNFTDVTKDEIDATFTSGTKNWTKWNDAANNRSYWACSPSYYAKAYPLTADNVVNKEDITGTHQDYFLDYFNWNAATNTEYNSSYGHEPKPIAWDATNGFSTGVAYPFETTASKASVNYDKTSSSNVQNPRAAVASVAITGTYTASAGASADGTFYLYGMGTDNHRVIYNKENIATPFLNIQNVVYKKVSETSMVLLGTADADLFEVVHPSWAVLKEGQHIISEGLVSLQLKGDNLTNLYFANADGTTSPVTTENLVKVNSKLITNVGTAEAFVGGKAWFNIPIRHIGFNWNEDCTLDGSNNSYDWSKVTTGYFGIVRNHVYTLKVNKISGIGYGVVNPANPLVPPVELDTYYIAYSLKILNWRVVPTQSVDL